MSHLSWELTVKLLFVARGFEDNCVNDGRWKYSLKACLGQRVLSLYNTLTQQAECITLNPGCLAGRDSVGQLEKWDSYAWGKRGSRPRGRTSDQDQLATSFKTLCTKPFGLEPFEKKQRMKKTTCFHFCSLRPSSQTFGQINCMISYFWRKALCIAWSTSLIAKIK